MAITTAQAPVGNLRSTAGTTVALNLGSTSTAGNLIVIAGGGFDNISSISGYGVGTWTKIQSLSGDASHNDSDFWYGTVTGTPAAAGTVTLLSSVTWWGGFVFELAGAQKATDVLVASGNDATGATTDSKTITTTVDGDIIVSLVSNNNGGSPQTATGPTGYTQLTNQVSVSNLVGCAYLIQTTHGASSMNWTGFNGTSTSPSLGGVSIKAAAAAAAGSTPRSIVSREAQRRSTRW